MDSMKDFPMRNVLFVLLAVVLVAIGGAFSAAPLTWSQSPDEAPQGADPRPDRAGNGNGRLGPRGESPGFPGPFFGPPGGMAAMLQAHPLWQALDLDGDGVLSAEELEKAPRSLRELDRDGDGTISPSELVEAFNAASGLPPGRTFDFRRSEAPGPEPESPGGFGAFPPGPGGFPGGRGGFPPMRQKRELIPEFDQDGDGYLNAEERARARAESPATRGRGGLGFPGGSGFGRGGPGGFGGRGGPPGGPGFGMTREAPEPGPRVSVDEVAQYPDESLYEPGILRTMFIEFEQEDWEAELADFKDTDVLVPATLLVDGVRYPDVGVSFRGMSSYMMVPAGFQRSFRLAFDFRDPEQNLYGYRTLNLLNQHGDPSLLSTVLYSHVARQYLPTPRANLVRVVVNGESWGIYTNLQQFNKDFLNENFGTTKGVRWKVPGSPMARGGLEYLGEEIEPYRAHYELKSKEKESSWRDLIALCRVLEETPIEDLEKELEKRVNLESLLWFLALDVALINNDGYWTRASDYSMYQDPDGLFHFLPYDMNEAFQGMVGAR
jgi:Ca2+-binding EF-hand superfamily protein